MYNYISNVPKLHFGTLVLKKIQNLHCLLVGIWCWQVHGYTELTLTQYLKKRSSESSVFYCVKGGVWILYIVSLQVTSMPQQLHMSWIYLPLICQNQVPDKTTHTLKFIPIFRKAFFQLVMLIQETVVQLSQVIVAYKAHVVTSSSSADAAIFSRVTNNVLQ